MASPSTERMIAKNKPEPGKEQLPASSGILYHLNNAGLLEEALMRQAARSQGRDHRIITRLVAWEVLSEAQRNGLHFPAPHRSREAPEPGRYERGEPRMPDSDGD